MGLSEDEVGKIAKETAESVVHKCRMCALNTMVVLSGLDLLNDAVSFYGKGIVIPHDIELEQIDVLRQHLSQQLGETIACCELSPDSPITKVKAALDKPGDIEAIKGAIENFEGALYQSLKEEGSNPGNPAKSLAARNLPR